MSQWRGQYSLLLRIGFLWPCSLCALMEQLVARLFLWVCTQEHLAQMLRQLNALQWRANWFWVHWGSTFLWRCQQTLVWVQLQTTKSVLHMWIYSASGSTSHLPVEWIANELWRCCNEEERKVVIRCVRRKSLATLSIVSSQWLYVRSILDVSVWMFDYSLLFS